MCKAIHLVHHESLIELNISLKLEVVLLIENK